MVHTKTRDLIVFVLLIALGVIGRWAQPMWNFTPLTAIAVLAGHLYARGTMAYLIPASVLLVSNYLLPSYGSRLVFLAVFAVVLLPVELGKLMSRSRGANTLAVFALCGFGPATVFFLVTNFFVWASSGLYEQSAVGLVACYTAGIPFYRTMLFGDIFYLSLFGIALGINSMFQQSNLFGSHSKTT